MFFQLWCQRMTTPLKWIVISMPHLTWYGRPGPEADILDQWWAPKPYQCITKSLDFKVGGYWLIIYERTWGEYPLVVKLTTKPLSPWSIMQALTPFAMKMLWSTTPNRGSDGGQNLKPLNQGTQVSMDLTITLEDLEAHHSNGFQRRVYSRSGKPGSVHCCTVLFAKTEKPLHQPRVSTYVNFPGNTEAAFTFTNRCLRLNLSRASRNLVKSPRASQPVVAEEIKDMVLHVELPYWEITSSWVPMHHPKWALFPNRGNNMHINLQPDSREEALRLFNALAEGGTIDMPMQDMFLVPTTEV